MNKLKETWSQIRDLYAGMPPGTRIVAGLLVAVLLVSLIYLVMPGKGTPSAQRETYLYGDYRFSQSEQMAVMDALGSAGLKDYTWEGYRLKVPAKKSEAYAAALSKAKAVPQDASALVLKNAQETNALVTKEDRNDRNFATSLAAAEKIIRKSGGVEDASVTGHSSWKWEGFKRVQWRTASVSVRMQRNRELDKNTRAGILAVVKSSLGINDAKDVMIRDENTGASWPGSEDWFQDGDGGYLEKKREEEFAFEQMIRHLFSDIDDLKVTASATVDIYKSWRQFGIEHKKPTSVASDSYSLKIDAEGGGPGRRPGYEMQKDNSPLPYRDVAMNSTLKFNEKESRDRELSALQGLENSKEYVPYPLLGISTSIRVPYAYFLKTLRQTKKLQGNDAVEPQAGEIDNWITQEIARMKQQLYTLLRTRNPELIDDAELEKLITIEPYHAQEMELPAEETAWQKLAFWFGANWKTMSLFGLVAASLGVLWGVTRPQKPEPIIIYEAPELPPMEADKDAVEDEDEETAFNRTLEPFNKSMRSLQEEVSELVNENPDAAANVIRQWIGRVAPQDH